MARPFAVSLLSIAVAAVIGLFMPKNWNNESLVRTSLAHNAQNLAKYEGRTEIDEHLLADQIRCTKRLEAAAAKRDPPKEA